MKRLHVHVSVDDLARSIQFYSMLFAAEPTVTKDELADVYSRLQRAEAPILEEGATTCCYAKSDKSWIEDPQGIQWETFVTTGESTTA